MFLGFSWNKKLSASKLFKWKAQFDISLIQIKVEITIIVVVISLMEPVGDGGAHAVWGDSTNPRAAAQPVAKHGALAVRAQHIYWIVWSVSMSCMRCSGSPRNHGASTPLVKHSLALVSAWHGSPGSDWDGWWKAGQAVLVLAGVFQHLGNTQDDRSVLVSLRSAALPWVPPRSSVRAPGGLCGLW